MCSANQINNSIEVSEELKNPENTKKNEEEIPIEQRIITKDGKIIDKMYEHLYDKHNLIVYDYKFFQEVKVEKPTVIIIDIFDAKENRLFDINCDDILDIMHGTSTMKIVFLKI